MGRPQADLTKIVFAFLISRGRAIAAARSRDGNAIIEAKLVEQPALVPPLPTHHRPVLRRRSPQLTESPFGATLNAFIDSIDPKPSSIVRVL